MPCCEIFDAQSAAYRDKVLPKSVRARVAVEAGCTQTWFRYVGLDGAVVGIDTFGESDLPTNLWSSTDSRPST
ncbi:MAG: transketolase-like TK C-terminal-containing protein [Christensenellales bacterium]